MADQRNPRARLQIVDLPDELLIDVITRLPLTNVAACRSSSTALRRSASPTPFFNALHSERSPRTIALQFKEAQRNPSSSLHLWDPEADVFASKRPEANSMLKPLFDLPKNSAIDINCSLRSRGANTSEYALTNSCNGLLYLTRKDRRCSLVCNPATNEYFFVGPAADGRKSEPTSALVEILGFSAVASRYKALRIVSAGDDIRAQVQVVGCGWWRNVALAIDLEPRDLANVDSDSVFLKGSAYWISYAGELKKVAYFDFDEEVFGEIELPFELEEVEEVGVRDCTGLGVLGKALCLSYNNGRDGFSYRVDLWVLRDEGGDSERIWTKDFSISTTTCPRGTVLHGMFRPLQVLSNGEVLIDWAGSDLLSYDPEKKSLKIIGLEGKNRRLATVGFTPSFVPLKDALVVEADRISTQSSKPVKFIVEPMQRLPPTRRSGRRRSLNSATL